MHVSKSLIVVQPVTNSYCGNVCGSKSLVVDDPVQLVRHGDVIRLIHGMTQRPLNR